MHYHGGNYGKVSEKVSLQELALLPVVVDPVEVLRVAITQYRDPTDWAQAHKISPSYVRQVLKLQRGFGQRLLQALNIRRSVMFEMCSDKAKSAGLCKRPDPAGYAVMHQNFVLWAGVNEGTVWSEILSWESQIERIRSVLDELTCRACSQSLLDYMRSDRSGRSERVCVEVDGVLCLEDEASIG